MRLEMPWCDQAEEDVHWRLRHLLVQSQPRREWLLTMCDLALAFPPSSGAWSLVETEQQRMLVVGVRGGVDAAGFHHQSVV